MTALLVEKKTRRWGELLMGKRLKAGFRYIVYGDKADSPGRNGSCGCQSRGQEAEDVHFRESQNGINDTFSGY